MGRADLAEGDLLGPQLAVVDPEHEEVRHLRSGRYEVSRGAGGGCRRSGGRRTGWDQCQSDNFATATEAACWRVSPKAFRASAHVD